MRAKMKQLACKDCYTPMIGPTTNRKRCVECQEIYNARARAIRAKRQREAARFERKPQMQ